MDFTVSDDLARQILALTKTDGSLASALAQQLMRTVDPEAMHAYLLTPDVAVALLTQRLRKQPEQTLRELTRLSEAARRPGGMRGRRSAAQIDRSADAARPTRRYRKRHRLSADQLAGIKSQVTAYLTQHPWANRKQITAATGIPTQAIYNRIISELKHTGEVISRGEKAKTAYSVKGAAAAREAAPAAAAGARTRDTEQSRGAARSSKRRRSRAEKKSKPRGRARR